MEIIYEEKEYEEAPKRHYSMGCEDIIRRNLECARNAPILPSTGSCDVEVISYQEEIASKRSTTTDELTEEMVREWGDQHETHP